MKIYKIIQTSLDIENPISTYVNANANILNMLIAKYEGICFNSCYIIKVLTIVKRSECIIMQNNESGNGSIDVKFRAQVIELMPNEILSNCVVIRKDIERKIIIATTENCALNINTEGIYDSIALGQKIPVKIKKCLYSVGSSRIQAYATPYIPSRKYKLYDFKGEKVTKQDLAIIKDIKELISDEEELFEDLDQKEIAFFSKVIYPYTNEISKITIPKNVNIIKLNTIKEGTVLNILGRPPYMDANKPDIYEWKKVNDIPDDADLETPTVSEGLNNIWLDYYQRLVLIREFVNTYQSKKDKESHVNLWKLFNNNKITL